MAYPDNMWCLGRPRSHEPSGNTALGWAEIPATCCARFACKDRKNSGIHPTLLTFGNDASAAEATSLEGHERRGRRVFDWENQLQVYGRFHGFDDLIGPFLSSGRIGGQHHLFKMPATGNLCHLYFGVMSPSSLRPSQFGRDQLRVIGPVGLAP